MLARIESCAAVMALLSVGQRIIKWAADSTGAPQVQVLSCSLPHLTSFSRELPRHKADTGLHGTWWQILESAAEHVTRIIPAAQEVSGVRRRSPCTTFSADLATPDLPKGCRGEGKEARDAGFGSAYRKSGFHLAYWRPKSQELSENNP